MSPSHEQVATSPAPLTAAACQTGLLRRAVTSPLLYVAYPLELDVTTASQGILAVANAAMANAVRAVATERGLDPRDVTLVAAGEPGPMHVVNVAVELRIARGLVSHAPTSSQASGVNRTWAVPTTQPRRWSASCTR